MSRPTSDVAFTPAVKSAQEQRGSRKVYAKVEARGGWRDEITDDLREFIAKRDSFYFGTASADGQPYIQHRGGPAGFLKVIDGHTLAFADFMGNRQYISVGNLDENRYGRHLAGFAVSTRSPAPWGGRGKKVAFHRRTDRRRQARSE